MFWNIICLIKHIIGTKNNTRKKHGEDDTLLGHIPVDVVEPPIADGYVDLAMKEQL